MENITNKDIERAAQMLIELDKSLRLSVDFSWSLEDIEDVQCGLNTLRRYIGIKELSLKDLSFVVNKLSRYDSDR